MCRLANAVAVLTICLGTPAYASVIYLETFDAPAFRGSFITTTASERAATTTYDHAIDANGWIFDGSAFLALVGTDGALSLNESPFASTATKAITGLAPNTMYQLAFNLTGDNVRNANSELLVSVNGLRLLDVQHSWSVTGNGTQLAAKFTSNAAGAATLRFAEIDGGNLASPILDDITVTTLPEPASVAAFGAGLLGMAAMRRRKRG